MHSMQIMSNTTIDMCPIGCGFGSSLGSECPTWALIRSVIQYYYGRDSRPGAIVKVEIKTQCLRNMNRS